MPTHSRRTLVLVLSVAAIAPWALAPAAASPPAPGSIVLSASHVLPGDSLVVKAHLNDTPAYLAFGFYLDMNQSPALIQVDGNLTSLGNGDFQVERTILADDYGGHYTLGWVYVCVQGQPCEQDYDGLTGPDGSVPGFFDDTSARPDLRVVALAASPSDPSPGQDVNVTLDFANVGNQTAHDYVVWLSSTPSSAGVFAGEPGPALAPGDTARFEGVYHGAQGNDTLYAILDSGGQIPDANRSDNQGSVTLAGPSLPDLVAFKPRAPIVARAGDVLQLSAMLANRGAGNATQFSSTLAVDGDVIATLALPGLAPGATGVINQSWVATTGDHEVRLDVDVLDEVAESNESNNVASVHILVLPPLPVADVGVQITGIDHERLRTEAGDLPHPLPRHTIHLSLTNAGDANVTTLLQVDATATLRFVPLSNAEAIATQDVTIPAHGSVALDVVWDPLLAVGDQTIRATVAPQGSYADPNPANDGSSAADFVIVGGLGGV